VLWLFQQFGLVDQVQCQGFAALQVVSPAGYLDQAAAAIFLAVAVPLGGVAQAFDEGSGIVFAQVLVATELSQGRVRIRGVTIWYRTIAVLKTDAKTPAVRLALERICRSCCWVIDLALS